MRNKILLTLLSGISMQAFAQTFPVSNLRLNGPDTNRVNLVFLAEGYRSIELNKFVTDAQGVRKDVFLQSPLKEYADYFNTYAIQVSSAESGASHPGTATDVNEPVIPVVSLNTFFQSTFDNGGAHRAIVSHNPNDVYGVAAQNVPAYDLLYVLVNTTEYGGTGGGFCVSTMHPTAAEIAVHEIGHTFAGLADEYWAGTVFAREHANMTAETDPAKVKWKTWLNTGSIGIYRYGTSGDAANWNRPHQNCKMQFLGVPFCGVCKQTIIDQIYTLVTPIDDYAPRTAANVPYIGTPLNFNLKLLRPNPNTLKVEWKLNGSTLPLKDTFVNITGTQLLDGNNTLVAYVTDTTLLSHSYRPASGYQFSVDWKIYKDPTGIATVEANAGPKFFYRVYPVPTGDNLTMSYTNETGATTLAYHITDIAGKVVQKGYMPVANGKQETTFNISSMAPGVYTLHCESKGVLFDARIVKE